MDDGAVIFLVAWGVAIVWVCAEVGALIWRTLWKWSVRLRERREEG